MKKVFSYILLLFACVLTFSVSVYAEEKYSCSYNVQYADGGYFNIKAIANKDGSYDVQYQTDSKTWQSTSSYKLGGVMYYKRGDTYVSEGTMMFTLSNLSSKNFEKAITSSKLTTDCPVINVQFDNSSMYYFYFADSSNDIYSYNIEGKLEGKKGDSTSEIKVTKTCPFTISTKKVSGMKNFTVYSSFRMKSDGSKLICASATSANLDSSCTPYTTGDYATNISFNGDVYSLKITSGDLNTIFSQTDAQKSKNEFTCPSSMYFVYTSVTDSTLLLTPDKSVAESYDKNVVGNASAEAEETKTEPSSNPSSGSGNNTDIEHVGDNFCENSNILSVLRMVGYALTLLKVFVPIIIIIWATLKFYQAVTAGSSEALSKQVKSLLYRIGIGVMVFFVPTLIDAVLVNFIPADSKKCEICVLKPFSCNPGDPSSIDTSDPTTITKWKDPKCESRNGSQRYCENKSGCKWNKSENKCEYAKVADSCANKCSAYDSTSDAYFHCIDGCLLTSPSSVTTPTEAKCEHRRESQTMCESASGCYWDEYEEEGNRCKYKNSGGGSN